MWLLKRKRQIHWSWCHRRWEFSCTIEIWYNQWLEVTKKWSSFIVIYWISTFLSHIRSILWNTHEAITQIIKTILQEVNSTDGLDAIIDRIFRWIEKGVTYSPVLARFDTDKTTLLNTDWRMEGMGWILVQSAYDEESQKTVKLLRETG